MCLPSGLTLPSSLPSLYLRLSLLGQALYYFPVCFPLCPLISPCFNSYQMYLLQQEFYTYFSPKNFEWLPIAFQIKENAWQSRNSQHLIPFLFSDFSFTIPRHVAVFYLLPPMLYSFLILAYLELSFSSLYPVQQGTCLAYGEEFNEKQFWSLRIQNPWSAALFWLQ